MLTTKELAAEYIRGFFDSEGAVVAGRSGSIDLSINNTSLDALNLIKELLQDFFQIKSTIYFDRASLKRPARKPFYHLRITKWHDVFKFVREIGITIERKLTKVCDFCQRFHGFGNAVTPIV